MSNVWSVRGVDPKVRETIVRAARARDIPVARLLEEAMSAVTSERSDAQTVVRALDERLQRLSGGAESRPRG